MKSTLFARIGFAATAGLLFSLVTVSAKADTVTLTMNEVPNQPINGLTVTKGGESFTFSDPIGSLFYNSNGPGTRTFVQDPTIQGPLQSFSVAFSVAVTSIQFGLAELAIVPLTGAQVTLSSGDTFLFNLSLVDPFAEGQFTHSGSPVTSFTLTPAPGAFALAFDNDCHACPRSQRRRWTFWPDLGWRYSSPLGAPPSSADCLSRSCAVG
jgi:hypothetical protein